MPGDPQISVIVPVYNGAKTISDCIESLLAQDALQNHEIICVDNGSTDHTVSILERYGKDIMVLHESKRGPAAARNRGLKNAEGEFIAFTDADCVVAKDWLRNLVQPLTDPEVGIAGGKILSKRPCNHIETFGEEIHDQGKAIDLYHPPYVITMNWASRKSILSEMQFFDEELTRCEDVDLSYRIYQRGYRLVFTGDAVVYHQNENNYRGLAEEGFLHGYYSVQLLKKHHGFVQSFGHRRWNKRSYLDLATSLVDSIRGTNRKVSRCQFFFNSGKKIGKMLGSVRYRYVDL